jgi:hypothetical protein
VLSCAPMTCAVWLRLPLLLSLTIASVACGSSRIVVRPTSPFEAVHARFYDDAADFIREPIALGGQWAADWDDDLRGRVGYADTVALVKIETLRTSIDVERRRIYHLVCRAAEVLRGALPEEDRIEVSVAEGSGGFETIARNERRLVEGQYLLFVKWVEVDDQVVPRWHLSPASDRALGDVRRMLIEASEAESRN